MDRDGNLDKTETIVLFMVIERDVVLVEPLTRGP